MNVEEYFTEREARDPEFRDAWAALQPEYEFERALIEARQAAGLTQRQLAELLGKKQSAIARMEAGKRPPRLDTLAQLARALRAEFSITADGHLTLQRPPRRELVGAR